MITLFKNLFKRKKNIEREILINWLNKRITDSEKIKNSLSKDTDLNIIISKGVQITVFKQVLEYVKQH